MSIIRTFQGLGSACARGSSRRTGGHASLRQLFEDDDYVGGVLGHDLGMFLGWHYYTGLSGSVVAHREAGSAPMVSPLLELEGKDWKRANRERKASVHRAFLAERPAGRVGFLELLLRPQRHSRTALEEEFGIGLCEDGEVSYFLVDWLLHRWRETLKGPSVAEGLVARRVERIATELGLLENGEETDRFDRLVTWCRHAMVEAPRRVYRRREAPKRLERSLFTHFERASSRQDAASWLSALGCLLLGGDQRSALDVATSARFNVYGHYALRKNDSGADKSIVYFPLVFPGRPEQPGLFFVATATGLARSSKTTALSHRPKVLERLEKIVPYASMVGTAMFGDIMAREEGALVRVLGSHGLRAPLAHLSYVIAEAQREDDVSRTQARLAEAEAVVEDVDKLVTVVFRLATRPGRASVGLGRVGDALGRCRSREHLREFERQAPLLTPSLLRESALVALRSVECRRDQPSRIREAARKLQRVGLSIDWQVDDAEALVFCAGESSRRPGCRCESLDFASVTLARFAIPELIANALKAMPADTTTELRLGVLKISRRQICITVTGPGKFDPEVDDTDLLLRAPPGGTRRSLGRILLRQATWSLGWKLTRIDQVGELTRCGLSLPSRIEDRTDGHS